MGLFSKLFKGPEPDMEKSTANAKKVRALFDKAVEDGEEYRLIVGYTEDVKRFNYGFVHGSKTQIGNLIVGWNETTALSWWFLRFRTSPAMELPPITARDEVHKAYRKSTPRTPLSSIQTERDISASTPMIGWKMRVCTSIFTRKTNWRHSRPFSRMSFLLSKKT